MFRVYCHTAARDGGELCVVLKYGSAAEATGSTVEAAAAKFCQAHNRRCEKAGLADRIALGTRHNVEFDVPPAEFRNRCDVNRARINRISSWQALACSCATTRGEWCLDAERSNFGLA